MDTTPLFSVIIPTHDRPQRLAACLEALASIDFSPDRFEVVVSDDGSPVSPAAVVAEFADRLRVTLVHGPKAGPGAARNRGAARAFGRFFVFTDDDCLAEPSWLRAFEHCFAERSDRLIGGGIVNGLPANRYSTATQLIVTYAYANNARRATGTLFFNTCNLAVPAEQFRQIGGFSQEFPLAAGEDYDFCHRWQHAGLQAAYAPEAVVRHAHALTPGSFCRQHFNYGRGLYRCRRRIAEREGRPLRVEAPTFYWGLVRFPLRQTRGIEGWVSVLLVLGSQAATFAGAVHEWLMPGGWKTGSREPSVESCDG